MTHDDLIHKFNISDCILCKNTLPLSPKPILQVHRKSRILLIGQAPGLKAHDSNKPWNDPSGDRLREWMGVSPEVFYDPQTFALMPMAFCYPGRGKSGDLPPSKLCAPQWHKAIIDSMDVGLTLLIGKYAQEYYLNDKLSLTERVKQWENYLPDKLVLPHPSPRNNIWLKRNHWFEEETVPALRARVQDLL